jgi:hypothetical protein
MRALSVDKDHADAVFNQRTMKKFEPGLPSPSRTFRVLFSWVSLGCRSINGRIKRQSEREKEKRGRRVYSVQEYRKSEDKAEQTIKGSVYYFV